MKRRSLFLRLLVLIQINECPCCGRSIKRAGTVSERPGTLPPSRWTARFRLARSLDARRLDARIAMAETTRLSVEETLKKLRSNDEQKSKTERRDEDMQALDEETKRMRAQRLRLERLQRKRD
jgi:hypothetical protein